QQYNTRSVGSTRSPLLHQDSSAVKTIGVEQHRSAVVRSHSKESSSPPYGLSQRRQRQHGEKSLSPSSAQHSVTNKNTNNGAQLESGSDGRSNTNQQHYRVVSPISDSRRGISNTNRGGH